MYDDQTTSAGLSLSYTPRVNKRNCMNWNEIKQLPLYANNSQNSAPLHWSFIPDHFADLARHFGKDRTCQQGETSSKLKLLGTLLWTAVGETFWDSPNWHKFWMFHFNPVPKKRLEVLLGFPAAWQLASHDETLSNLRTPMNCTLILLGESTWISLKWFFSWFPKARDTYICSCMGQLKQQWALPLIY